MKKVLVMLGVFCGGAVLLASCATQNTSAKLAIQKKHANKVTVASLNHKMIKTAMLDKMLSKRSTPA